MNRRDRDTPVPKAKRFGIGDQRHVQAQRVWLILTAHVMMEWQWRGRFDRLADGMTYSSPTVNSRRE